MSTKKIVLKSSDNESFEVDEAVARESQTLAHMVEDDCTDNGIPLPNVTGKILAKVIEYCKKHVDAAAAKTEAAADGGASSDDDLKAWDAEFMKIDQATLFELILVRLVSPLFDFVFNFAILGFSTWEIRVCDLGVCFGN